MKIIKKIKKLLKIIGPGFITGAADDDPSGIATYSQTGAIFGLRQLWLPFWIAPFTAVIQETCARIGLITGQGLSGIIKKNHSQTTLYFIVFILFFVNTVNIGANLGAMAETLDLLFKLPSFTWLIVITVVTISLEILVPYQRYVKYLKYLGLTLLAYLITAVIVKQDWTQTLKASFIPNTSFEPRFLFNLVAFFGTTISPYLFFWQTYEEVEEQIAHHHAKALNPYLKNSDRTLRHMRLDTVFGMFYASLIAYFIIVTTASTLHIHDITDIQTASQAAEALRPLAGNFTYFLFALGIVGAGLLGIPILAASTAYAISEAFNFKFGLSYKFTHAKKFYLTIVTAIVLGLLINLLPIPPFKMLYYAAALNGLVAPILMFFIIHIANNKSVMGKHTNSVFTNIISFFITLIMSACGLLLIYDLLFK